MSAIEAWNALPRIGHGCEVVGSGTENFRLWFHAESDCYFWRPAGEDPGDPLCDDVTGYPVHELTARERGVVRPCG
jgi:hypothetical protein